MALLQNAVFPLSTPTHDGSGQGMHPSVVDFYTEHSLNNWAGYRYWMAMTPYPGGNDEHEDPNVLASQDGVKWVVPNGLSNPLDNIGGVNYNADTDAVFDPIENCLRVYYRAFLANGDGTNRLELRLVKLFSDMSFTQPIACSPVLNPYSTPDDKMRSQAVWRESSSSWHMWGNRRESNGKHTLWHSTSEDGIVWANFQQCLDGNGVDPFQAKGYENWHLSAKPNRKEDRIEFCISDRSDTYLLYAECPMNNPLLVTLPLAEPILTLGTAGNFDDTRLYRSVFVIEDLGDKYNYKLWYTGVDNAGVWHIGFTQGVLGTTYSNPVSPTDSMTVFIGGEYVDIALYSMNDLLESDVRIFINGETSCVKLVTEYDVKSSKINIFKDGQKKVLEKFM